ncbi:unnamed protein product [Paramecium octaurelia]|uniref:Uncharacterized protein n=1 Tax=Paramecium octaurelia TaxID=43137 RepID=A0A8S1XY53_PAROT|nr:unnamed protein product [Paramecium octaurelia]
MEVQILLTQIHFLQLLIYSPNLNHSILNDKIFNDKIKQETPQISKIVKNYLAGKFINKVLRNTMPKLESSDLMNKQLIALLNLSVPWFNKCVSVNQIYKFEVESGSNYNFNILGNSLFKRKGQTLFCSVISKLIRIGIMQRSMYFAIFHLPNGECLLTYQEVKDPSSSLFILDLKYSPQILTIKQVCSINTNHYQKIQLTTQFSIKSRAKVTWIRLGGSGYEQHRIWIDGKQLQASRLIDEDKTFQSGPILQNNIHLLDTNSHKPHLNEEQQRFHQNQLMDVIITLNQKGNKDYRGGIEEQQTSNPLLPISEEEEEKQQGK